MAAQQCWAWLQSQYKENINPDEETSLKRPTQFLHLRTMMKNRSRSRAVRGGSTIPTLQNERAKLGTTGKQMDIRGRLRTNGKDTIRPCQQISR